MARVALVLALIGPACGGPAVRQVPIPYQPRADQERAADTPQEPPLGAAETAPAGDTDGPSGAARAQTGASGVADPTTAPAGEPATEAAPVTEDATAAAADPADDAESTPAADAPPTAVFPGREVLGRFSVQETTGRFRMDEAVRTGLPLSRGACRDVASLRAWRASDGAALPLQARPLSRWPDGSLRWVVLDTRVDLAPRDERAVVVGTADDLPAVADPWTLAEDGEGALTVSDGRHTWTVLRDGLRGPEVLGLRGTLVDRFGHAYQLEVDPDSLTVLERGPLRLVLRVTGAHRRVDGGLPIDFHTVTAHLHLLAHRREGSPATALVEWSLENGPLEEPPGRLAFRSYTLDLDPPAGVERVDLPSRNEAGRPSFDLLTLKDGPLLRVRGERAGTGRSLAQWVGLTGADGELFVHRVDAAGNHPAGLAWDGTGPLQVRLLPELPNREYWLDDATRKTFRLHLVRDADGAGPSRMLRLDDPAHPALSPLTVALSGAWGDAGHWYQPDARELDRAPQVPPPGAPTGWTDWGEALATNTHSSGSPRNQLSVFLEALQSGRADLFRWARTRAWHAMDLRPFHIQGFDADRFPEANLHEGTPHPNERAAVRLGRSGMEHRFPDHKSGLPRDGHGYNGFDPEHMTLDDIYECYLLTGSWPALSALRSAGEAMLTWKEVLPGGVIHNARSFGWTLRALVQVHRATGDPRYLEAAADLVARADAGRGRGPVKYLSPNPPDARHLPDHESEQPWMVAVALHGLAAYHVETADPIVPPMMADLASLCLSAYRGGSFQTELATDGTPVEVPLSPRGVGAWIPGGIAAAAFVTGDHSGVDRVLPYFRLLRADPRRPIHFGGNDWHWWQAYLASLVARHGREIVDAR